MLLSIFSSTFLLMYVCRCQRILYVMNSLFLFSTSETENKKQFSTQSPLCFQSFQPHLVAFLSGWSEIVSSRQVDLVLRIFGQLCMCLCVYTYYINILFLPIIWNVFYLFLTAISIIDLMIILLINQSFSL